MEERFFRGDLSYIESFPSKCWCLQSKYGLCFTNGLLQKTIAILGLPAQISIQDARLSAALLLNLDTLAHKHHVFWPHGVDAMSPVIIAGSS